MNAEHEISSASIVLKVRFDVKEFLNVFTGFGQQT
jgi:hypothetical protein